ncbi:hypothetical protein [Luteimonas abyssi]|uniref:hypothetical protein n=1 Tax=Luteimonas abyssi TaxID=1247514 RepID=UPI000A8838D7|nr:hypothetical protein [Luteimonas abyssi]
MMMQKKIWFYLHIDDEIERLKDRISITRNNFYDQTFTSNIQWTEMGILSIGFKVEKEVANLLDEIIYYEHRIEWLRKKQRYVNDYLLTLDKQIRNDFLMKYTKDPGDHPLTELDQEFYEELLEIEEAMNHMRNIPLDQSNEILNVDFETLQDKFDDILNMLKV